MTRKSRGTKMNVDWATHGTVKPYTQHPKEWSSWMLRKNKEFKEAEEGWEEAEADYDQTRTDFEAVISDPSEDEDDPCPVLDHIIYRSNYQNYRPTYQRIVRTRVGTLIQRIRGLSKEQHRVLWGKARRWKKQAAEVQFARMELNNKEPFCYPTPDSKEAHLHRTKVAKSSATDAYGIQIAHGSKGWTTQSRPNVSNPNFEVQKDLSEILQNDQTVIDQAQPPLRLNKFQKAVQGVKSLIPNSRTRFSQPRTTTMGARVKGGQGLQWHVNHGGVPDKQASVLMWTAGVAESCSAPTPPAAFLNTVNSPQTTKAVTNADKAAISRKNQEEAKARLVQQKGAVAAAAEEDRKANAAVKAENKGKPKLEFKNNSKPNKLTKLQPNPNATANGNGKEKSVPKKGKGKRG